jgi:hypothetical protein
MLKMEGELEIADGFPACLASGVVSLAVQIAPFDWWSSWHTLALAASIGPYDIRPQH